MHLFKVHVSLAPDSQSVSAEWKASSHSSPVVLLRFNSGNYVGTSQMPLTHEYAFIFVKEKVLTWIRVEGPPRRRCRHRPEVPQPLCRTLNGK